MNSLNNQLSWLREQVWLIQSNNILLQVINEIPYILNLVSTYSSSKAGKLTNALLATEVNGFPVMASSVSDVSPAKEFSCSSLMAFLDKILD